MAIDPKKVPITREEVAGWLNIYKQANPTTVGSIRDFLISRIAAKKMPDTDVDTSGHDNLEDVTPLVDMILADLESYGYSG